MSDAHAVARAGAALALLWAAGCAAPDKPLAISVGPSVARPPAAAVLFFVDGMDKARLAELVSRGRLPNIERLFVRGGVGVDYAITSIPAMTYPNATSIMTGLFPGHHGIVGNQWFDRNTMESPNYITLDEYLRVNDDLPARTLYEMLPDRPSVNIQCNVRRGCSFDVPTFVATGLGWSVGLYECVDQFIGGSFEQAGWFANKSGCWPSLVVLYFPGLDEIGHHQGSDSTGYERELRIIDCQVGRVVQAVERAGMGGRTTFVLVSDHGQPSTRQAKVTDVVAWLRDSPKLRVHEGVLSGGGFAARVAFADRFDAIVTNGSYRRLALHLRGPHGWLDRLPPERVRALLEPGDGHAALAAQPGVGLVCLPLGADRVGVLTPRGAAAVERRREGERRMYRLTAFAPGDVPPARVVEYDNDAALRSFVDAGWHDSREWLAETAESRYPDFVPQIVEYFDSSRAGDCIVFCEAGWVFRGHEAGAHGSAIAEDMGVPLYFSGPGLPAGGRIHHARIVDVAPTIVDLLGDPSRRAASARLDGVSLLSELRSATIPK